MAYSRSSRGGHWPSFLAGADIAVYNEANGLWFIKQSMTGTTASFAYGGTGFTPVNY